jgi:hypothetical protein
MLSILEPSCPRIVIDAFRKAEMPYDEKTMEKRQQEQHAEHASQLGLKNHAKKKAMPARKNKEKKYHRKNQNPIALASHTCHLGAMSWIHCALPLP